MYHISDVKKYTRCPKLFWLNQKEVVSDEYQPFIHLEKNYNELLCKKLKIDHHFEGYTGQDSALSLAALKNEEWLVNARFEYGKLRVKIPFIHRTKEGYDIFFSHLGNYPKEGDIQYYCNCIWVLEMNDMEINNISIIHLNANYIRKNELDVEELFIISDNFYNAKNYPSKNIKQLIMRKIKNIDYLLEEMDEVLTYQDISIKKTNRCHKRNKCQYYDHCFPNEHLEDDSILTLVSSQNKYSMQKEGITKLQDVDLEQIEGTRLQFAQIMAAKNNGMFIDREALSYWLENIQFPITFIDFEWDTYAIPPYEGMKPFDVLPFQYSIHVLYENGNLEHKEFIGINDSRKDFVESMLLDIPQRGSLVAFNAEGAEKIRIKEFALNFSLYKNQLLALNERMIDLAFPFQLGLIYDIRMKGQYSLKTIMGLMENQVGYKGLDIAQGMDAVFEWRRLNDDFEHNQKILANLKEYCGMDTYSMVVVYNWLKKLVK